MFTLNCKGRLVVVDKPLVMGILNVTPDSFFPESRLLDSEKNVLSRAEKMINEGASILDIGAQSTRPGASMVGPDEERKRLIPIVELLANRFPGIILSVDSFHASVVSAAVAAGADMVNDISGGSFDSTMLSTVASLGVPYICMHVQGTADTMHQSTSYSHFITDLLDYFISKKAECQQKGIKDLIIDPGFGFSKTVDNNLSVLKNLHLLDLLGLPILLGVSRKSTISKILNTTTEHALNGTTVLNTIGLLSKASILRVHDVLEASQAIALVEEYKKAGN